MSKELRKNLCQIVDEDLPEYKRIILQAYDTGEVLVPFELSITDTYRNLVRTDIFLTPENKEGYFSCKLSKKGEEIALKLDSERKKIKEGHGEGGEA